MADETEKSDQQRVLRVNQLDAAQLDEEVIHLLRSQLNKAFQYFEVGVLTKYEAELNGLLRFLVWRIWRCINAGEKLLQALSVLNFLVFLQKGKYPSVLERVLGIHPVFAQRQSIRQVSFEFMTRELLWHGFAEFVFFLLPLINIHKLKNLIVRRFSSPASLVKQPSIKVACHECGICNEPPTAPHQGQCGHVFCYYCIKANSLADPSFPCPLCGAAVGDEITPVECTVALEVT
ncbi:peroxisome biogenesis factor 2-like [Orbicella faveolata]|uniref:peroxisome biogenesis factor 2-like n=1 Tax=Orbicella faveolata TaxID=48498 RepID=UPI0009E4F7C1|nr:peroxisome biogenesis factor 2-like [Orbicella faveolata]